MITISPNTWKIMLALLPFVAATILGFGGWAVKAWADERYIENAELNAAVLSRDLEQKDEQIADLDDTLFEIEQELLFVDAGSPEARKYLSIKQHYLNRKATRVREREVIVQKMKAPPE